MGLSFTSVENHPYAKHQVRHLHPKPLGPTWSGAPYKTISPKSGKVGKTMARNLFNKTKLLLTLSAKHKNSKPETPFGVYGMIPEKTSPEP